MNIALTCFHSAAEITDKMQKMFGRGSVITEKEFC